MASGDEDMVIDEEPKCFDDYKLPEKMTDRGNLMKVASELDVEMNGYAMDLRGLQKEIYHYRIAFTKITERKERDLTRGQKQDFAVQQRRRVCMSLFNTLMKKHENLFPREAKYDFVYDCGNSLYAKSPLPNESGDAIIKLELLPADISSSNTKKFLGSNYVKIDVEIQLTNCFHIQLQGEAEQIRETQRFLEIVTSAGMVKNEDHILFGNKAYERSSKNDAPLPQGKVVKCGFEKNCRVVELAGEALAMLQIGAKRSPFFSQVSVVAFCEAHLGLDSRRGVTLEDALRNRSSKLQIVRQLKDIAVRTTHTDLPRVLYINGLTEDNALQAKFEYEGEEISVNEYFLKRYKRQLAHPHLPLCIERRAQGAIYHPMEVLEIERGQRVTTEKQTPQMSETMIRECQLPPLQMKNHIENQIVTAVLTNENPFLKAWGIRISTRPIQAAARRFYPPAINYAGNMKVQPAHHGDLQWRLGAREQFTEPAKLQGRWTFLIFDGCIRTSDAEAFVDALVKYCTQHGLQISSREVDIREVNSEVEQNLDQLMKHISGTSKFVMFTTKMKLDPIHGFMKRLEAQYGIVNQHVSSATLNKAIGQKGAFMVLGNLCLKLNLKLGGVNHSLRTCDQMTSGTKNLDASMFPKTRMFVGFDVSHAGPQSFAERQMKKEQSEPTVVGMAYTLGEPTKIRGTYWMQAPRLSSISDIASNFAMALKDFYKDTNSLPLDIVVFRGGVSEGEFKKVVGEMIDLQKAFVEVNHLYRHGMYSPSLTCLVIQTSSNYRVIPTRIDPRARPMDQNVPCGTVVDDAVHPSYNEFLIIPQKALQGTARTVRCTLVMHSKGTSGTLPTMEELRQITYTLCHGHQVVCGSTTLPSVCYSATNLSKRGRNNWKAENFRDMDDGSMASSCGGDRGRLAHDGTPDFFKNLSAQLRSDIHTHYWA